MNRVWPDSLSDLNYAVMDEAERRHLMESLIDEIQIYEERQPNGQWLKSIRFKLPIIDEDMSLSLDNDSHIESVVKLTRAGSRLQVECIKDKAETKENI